MRNVHGMIIPIVAIYVMATCNGLQEFHVGGAEGWVPHPSQPLNEWARINRFHINDRLVFEYKKDEDSVLVVKKQQYDTCDTSVPYLKLSGGKSIYDLGQSGEFFFISGNHTRCEEGEKVVIMVMADRSPPPPLPASPPPASHSPPSPPSHTSNAPLSNKTTHKFHPLSHNSSSLFFSSNRFLGLMFCLLVLTIGVIISG